MAQLGKFEILSRRIGKKKENKLITSTNEKIVKRR